MKMKTTTLSIAVLALLDSVEAAKMRLDTRLRDYDDEQMQVWEQRIGSGSD